MNASYNASFNESYMKQLLEDLRVSTTTVEVGFLFASVVLVLVHYFGIEVLMHTIEDRTRSKYIKIDDRIPKILNIEESEDESSSDEFEETTDVFGDALEYHEHEHEDHKTEFTGIVPGMTSEEDYSDDDTVVWSNSRRMSSFQTGNNMDSAVYTSGSSVSCSPQEEPNSNNNNNININSNNNKSNNHHNKNKKNKVRPEYSCFWRIPGISSTNEQFFMEPPRREERRARAKKTGNKKNDKSKRSKYRLSEDW